MKRAKKAFTLVEIIVSLALIAIVSIMLVSILVPAANLQKTADLRNQGLNNAAQPLELSTTPSATAGASVSPSATSIDLGNGVTSGGTMYKSTDTKNNIALYQFVPSTS